MTESFDRLQTAFAGRYHIERELGRGGMASVYLAEDVKHARKVAIKVLPPELTAALGVERFNREIAIAAKLSHPHVLPLYDSGEAGGFLFYVMPYVEGESLRDRLEREEQLPLEDALQIAREVADGLNYAHSYGVVHRDIKPENVLLSGGHAVIADFGVARAISAADDDQLTGTGFAIGTPAYMSPEQASGKMEIDGRSDQYALGCLLYEMLAGQAPFAARTTSGLLNQHLTVPPPPVTALRPSVPPELGNLLFRLLSKAPADRFSTAQQVVQTLSTIETKVGTGWVTPVQTELTPAASRRRPTAVALGIVALVIAVALGGRYLGPAAGSDDGQERLVVLPFENRGQTEDEYLADGLTDEIIDRLSGIGDLMVIARTSAMRYKRTTLTVPEIAEQLGVDYVLVGTVMWDRSQGSDGRVRVSSELIDAADETRVWAERFDGAFAEVFQVQSRIAERVADELNIRLAEPERRTLASRPTDNYDAYDFFLRGNDYFNRGWLEQDVRTALDLYQRAVDLDSSFALAHARLSKTHSLMFQLRFDRSQARLHLAKQAVDRALVLAPDLAAAHEALGHYFYWGFRDYEPAIAAFFQSRSLQENNATVHNAIGNVRRRQGEWDAAIASYTRAAELDPRSHIIAHNLAEAFYLTRRYDRVEEHLERARLLGPDFLDAYVRQAMLELNARGDVAAARATLREAATRIDPTNWRPLWGWWALGLFRVVDGEEADGVRMEIGRFGADSSAYYLAMAEWLGRSGNKDAARIHYDSARVVLEALAAREPDWARYQGELGIAYAGLGRVGEAVRQGQIAQQLLPLRRDALDGPDWILNLARIYVLLGDYDRALEEINRYLAIPSRLSSRWLELDPFWAPLRDHPDYRRAIVEE